MNLLHFVHTYVPVYGGTTTRLMNLFSNDGNKHSMIVPYMGSQYVPTNIRDLRHENIYRNIFVKRVPLSIYPQVRAPFFEYISRINNWKKNARQLLDGVEESNFDLVYGHMAPMEFALAAKFYSFRNKIPFILEIHGLVKDSLFVSPISFKKFFNTFGNFLIQKMEKAILTKANYIIVQTKSMKKRVIDEYHVAHSKIEVAYNGVDIERFSPSKYKNDKTNLEAEMHLESKIVFSYFGFLDKNNGLKFFLQALNNLPCEIKNRIKVLVIGRGPYTKLVGDFAADNDFLNFLGLVEYDLIPQYYSITDVFVIPRPSNQATETLIPMKLLETMSMENIVLVSNVHGMTEVVTDGVNGIVYRERDINDFQRKVIDIINNLKNYKPLGRIARNTVLENYTWVGARKNLEGVYKKAIVHE